MFNAYVIKAILGFGPGMLTIPVLSYVLSVKAATSIAVFGDLTSNSILIWKERKSLKTSVLKKIGPALFIGSLIGVSIMSIANEIILKRIMGVGILVYLLISVVKPQLKLKTKWQKRVFGWLFGIIGGISGGIFNTNGPLIYMYLDSVSMKKDSLRANLMVLFFFDCVWRIAMYVAKGMVTWENMKFFAILFLPSLIVGLFLGNKLDKWIDSEKYNFISKGLMFLTAAKLIL
jgi:uncharacterized protein